MQPNWIDRLPAEARADLTGAMRPRAFVTGTLIYNRTEQPTGLYLIRSGTARFQIDGTNGKRLLLRIIAPGELFGETVALDDHPAPISVEARSDLDSLFLSAARLAQLKRRHRAIESALATAASANLRRALHALEELALMPLAQRTLSRLRLLAGESDPASRRREGVRLDIRQSELAEMLGASRQAVNAELGSLERRGLLERRFGELLCRPALLA